MRPLALLVLLAVPLAGAQTLLNPIEGGYEDVYIVTGRGVDALGSPTVGATVWVELDQSDVTSAPVKATADCFGVFITYFELRDIRRDGEVHIRLEGRNGGPNVTTTLGLDHFYRRSDTNLRYEGRWDTTCPDQSPLFHSRISVTGRILNRTEQREEEGAKYFAEPFQGVVTLRYWPNESHAICPPDPQVPIRCDANAGARDERGDFRYSWVFPEAFTVPEGARVEILADGKSWNITVDPTWRVATALIETTGQGPTPYPTPGAPLAVLLVAVGLVAVALGKRR